MRIIAYITRYLIRCCYFLLILCGITYFLFATTTGAEVIIRATALFVPGKLKLGPINGTLYDRLEFQNVSYTTEQGVFTIKQLNIVWHPLHLLNRKIVVSQLNIDGVDIKLANQTSPTDSGTWGTSTSLTRKLSLLSCLNYIDLQRFRLNNLTITNASGMHRINDFNIERKSKDLYILQANSVYGNIIGDIHFEPQSLNWRVSLTGDQLQLYPIAKDWPGKIHLLVQSDGQWSQESKRFNVQLSELSGVLKQSSVTGFANIHYDNGHLMVDPSSLQIGDALIHIAGSHINRWDLKWQVQVNQLQKTRVLIDGQMTGPTNEPELKARVNEMTLIPEVKNIKGQLNAKLHLAGTSANPTYTIDLQLQNGEVTIPYLNINVKEINLDSKYQVNQPMFISGSLLSEKGRAQFNGSIALHTLGFPIKVNLDGENLQVANLAEYKINASPHVQLEYKDKILKVTGKINIPYAEITPKDFANINTLPNEVEFINQPKEQTTVLMPNVELNLQFVLGQNIYLAYENLRANLQGNISISQKVGSLPTAIGELFTVKGKYRAYGNQFKIDNGRLIYAGNILSNPGLNIRASKTLEMVDTASVKSQFDTNTNIKPMYLGSKSLIVGIAVTGTLKNPLVSLFSNLPELSRADILSYILFGYPESNIKDANKLTLLASALNQGSNMSSKNITKKIKKVLGLSELSIGSKEYFDAKSSSTMNDTSLTVGKRFGKRLSLQYSIGLFNPINIFSLRFQINKRLSIQSETSPLDTGADLIYEYEKD